MDWMNPVEALKYLGLRSLEDLEDMLVDFEIPVQVGNDGELVKVGTDGIQEVLIERHHQRVGFRPSDERWKAQADRELKLREDKEAKVRVEHGKRLATKVKRRREASRDRGRVGSTTS